MSRHAGLWTGNRLVVLLLAVVLLIGGSAMWRFIQDTGNQALPGPPAPFDISTRPQQGRFLFDYAGVVRHYEESAQAYLQRIVSRYHIEALVVSLPALPEQHNLDTLAVDLINNWRVGAATEGRGLLLLLDDDSKAVRLEVAYALEDVFTDSFSGYIEDLQLGPYYRAGDLGTGLIAVMEMLEQRAQIKHQGDYTPAQIAQADAELLSGGAGARRQLAQYGQRTSLPAAATGSGHGASSPERAWEIMLTKWAGEGNGIDTDIYTQMTRLAMGDPDNPDSRTLRALDHWRHAEYQVLTDGTHAVIWFGAIDGWDNAPFLFCNSGDGWKFDIVHQRRLVVMHEAPRWKVAQGPYPYVALMHEAGQSTAKDLPLGGADLYRCADDAALAAQMRELEATLKRNTDDLEALVSLARLNVITGQRPNKVTPLLERAKELAPQRPEPYKYSAIFNVNSFFQYKTALAEIDQYIRLEPDSAFGYQVKGFLLYRLGRYRDSITALEQAVARDYSDSYAYILMARDYALLYGKASGVARSRYRTQALAMQHRAEAVARPDVQRLHWLDKWPPFKRIREQESNPDSARANVPPPFPPRNKRPGTNAS